MRRRWILAGSLIALVSASGLAAAGLWVASADLRAAWAQVDGWVNPPTIVRPDSAALTREVRALARLETANARLEQRIVGQRGTDASWGWVGERMELVARGEASAGVDLAGLADGDLRVHDDGSVTVRLPRAEIWRVHLDEEATFVAARERGWLGWPDAQLESEVRRAAVRSLRDEAERIRLDQTADAQARLVVGDLLRAAGATDVRFE